MGHKVGTISYLQADNVSVGVLDRLGYADESPRRASCRPEASRR